MFLYPSQNRLDVNYRPWYPKIFEIEKIIEHRYEDLIENKIETIVFHC